MITLEAKTWTYAVSLFSLKLSIGKDFYVLNSIKEKMFVFNIITSKNDESNWAVFRRNEMVIFSFVKSRDNVL